MNHRQWKKKFKKIHGRNPNYWEDKRKKIKYDVSVLIDAINEIPRIFARACANACEVLSQGLATLSEHMKNVAENYGRNEDEKL